MYLRRPVPCHFQERPSGSAPPFSPKRLWRPSPSLAPSRVSPQPLPRKTQGQAVLPLSEQTCSWLIPFWTARSWAGEAILRPCEACRGPHGNSASSRGVHDEPRHEVEPRLDRAELDVLLLRGVVAEAGEAEALGHRRLARGGGEGGIGAAAVAAFVTRQLRVRIGVSRLGNRIAPESSAD